MLSGCGILTMKRKPNQLLLHWGLPCQEWREFNWLLLQSVKLTSLGRGGDSLIRQKDPIELHYFN